MKPGDAHCPHCAAPLDSHARRHEPQVPIDLDAHNANVARISAYWGEVARKKQGLADEPRYDDAMAYALLIDGAMQLTTHNCDTTDSEEGLEKLRKALELVPPAARITTP